MELTAKYFDQKLEGLEKRLDKKFISEEYLDQRFDKFEQRLDEKLDQKLDQKFDEKLKNFATKDDLAFGLDSLEKRLELKIHNVVDQLAVIIDRSVAQPMGRHFSTIKAHQRR